MKKKSSHRLAVRRRRRPRFFLFLFLLPCFFFPCRNQIDIAHRERRRSKSIVTDLLQAVSGPCIVQYGARSRILLGCRRSAYRSAGRPTPILGGKIRNGRPCN
ncbi:hypothetical protein B296_00058730 [Ensete ventricosum]|uniref:Secreted protein n=1 Tax=Ensete ventricosum TaxID=4639 RepID=A0A426XKX4_ENSVE|nr:hypothetical protein B296_00058730 [Ensete ventricosum]